MVATMTRIDATFDVKSQQHGTLLGFAAFSLLVDEGWVTRVTEVGPGLYDVTCRYTAWPNGDFFALRGVKESVWRLAQDFAVKVDMDRRCGWRAWRQTNGRSDAGMSDVSRGAVVPARAFSRGIGK